MKEESVQIFKITTLLQKNVQGTKRICQGTWRVPRVAEDCKWVPRIAKRMEKNFKSVTRKFPKEKELQS